MTICITFLLAWTPYSVIALLSILGHAHRLHHWLLALAAVCAKTSCVYTPFIYAKMNPAFRTAARQVRVLCLNFTNTSIENLDSTADLTRQKKTRTHTIITHLVRWINLHEIIHILSHVPCVTLASVLYSITCTGTKVSARTQLLRLSISRGSVYGSILCWGPFTYYVQVKGGWVGMNVLVRAAYRGGGVGG